MIPQWPLPLYRSFSFECGWNFWMWWHITPVIMAQGGNDWVFFYSRKLFISRWAVEVRENGSMRGIHCERDWLLALKDFVAVMSWTADGRATWEGVWAASGSWEQSADSKQGHGNPSFVIVKNWNELGSRFFPLPASRGACSLADTLVSIPWNAEQRTQLYCTRLLSWRTMSSWTSVALSN